ncbi:uncharacterized protein [Apostichopus japonicus]|uniref:uncharacterized protein isoform X2 n=1 Tax=Stichopus japonicus TaxID=307972 RepID=UPI003AB49DDB
MASEVLNIKATGIVLALAVCIRTFCSGSQGMPTKSIVCEGEDYDISCKVNQTIKIIYASYGFQYNDSEAREQCDDVRNILFRNLEGVRCDPNSTLEASAVCNGLMACTISSSDKMFTDTCQGVTKYLVVEYYCREVNGNERPEYGDDTIVIDDEDDDNVDDPDDGDDDHDDDIDDESFGDRKTGALSTAAVIAFPVVIFLLVVVATLLVVWWKCKNKREKRNLGAVQMSYLADQTYTTEIYHQQLSERAEEDNELVNNPTCGPQEPHYVNEGQIHRKTPDEGYEIIR